MPLTPARHIPRWGTERRTCGGRNRLRRDPPQCSPNRTCAVCGVDLDYRQTPRSGFCSSKHYYKWRDARRHAPDLEGQRERARAYYRANREKVLEKAAAKRGTTRAPKRTTCEECGDPLTGQQRVSCGKASCRDRRFKRTNPEAYAERERQKVKRRRERRRLRGGRRRRANRRKRSTNARGYGVVHQALRRRWAPKVVAGVVDCDRCGRRIEPGEPWDLGHDDHNRSRWTGPEHRRCNRATSKPRPRTREW
jgi:hypothetical protein